MAASTTVEPDADAFDEADETTGLPVEKVTGEYVSTNGQDPEAKR